VRDRPALAGFADFDPGDAKVGEDGPKLSVWKVFALMFSQRVILIISLIEFCSGFLRQSIMQYGKIYAEEVGRKADFVFANWGVFTCAAGILGGMFAGVISDHLFQSRRGPVTAVLYGIMVLGGVVTLFTYDTSLIGPVTITMSMAVIGVHGMLSGTASMDFGGRQNTGIAVGIIDGFVYLGTGLMALLNAFMLPSTKTPEAAVASNWLPLFISMIPVALIGLALSLKLWNAKPQRAGASGH
jgi:OPA family glycerol-3-phosphate transporter-like MFS transporter